jgi:DNA polymerase
MLKHILEVYGITLPDLQISTLTRRLEDPDLPEPVKELLNLRLESSGTSTKKFGTLLKSACLDGRLRGIFQFSGAPRTSRFASRIFQAQNLPRPKFPHEEVEIGISLIKSGCADLVYDNVTAMVSSAVRGAIIAPPGKKLVISDLSAIEGRVLAWLANEEWKIDYYRDFDLGLIEYDVYKMTYAKTFGVDSSTVGKTERQYGKVIELFGGYGGGVGAFLTFAKAFNIDLTAMAEGVWDSLPGRIKNEAAAFYEYCVEEKKTHGLDEMTFIACDSIKRLWREANPNITKYWKLLEDGARTAIEKKKEARVLGSVIDMKGSWLRVKLPSGRFICYAGAQIVDDKLKYLGINQYTRKWCKLSTYGGKVAENLTQALSRDILCHGMQLAEKNGYEVVMHVHDELVTEVPDTKDYSHEELSKIMSTQPSWAPGLPLAAAGFESYRYRKD